VNTALPSLTRTFKAPHLTCQFHVTEGKQSLDETCQQFLQAFPSLSAKERTQQLTAIQASIGFGFGFESRA
jgi:hypothetical protein